MNRTLRFFALGIAAYAASASASPQSTDEWSSFPMVPAEVVDAGTPAPKAAPAPTPPPAPVPPPTSSPAARPASAKAAATVDAGTKSDEPAIISTKEKYEPGSEPHSPGTWGNGFTDDNGRISTAGPSLSVLRVSSARIAQAGIVRLSALGEYSSLTNFPVVGATNIRSGATFGVSVAILKWWEAYVGYSAAANTSSRTSPNLIQSLGDLQFGLKAAHQFFNGFYAGVDLRLNTFSGVGNQSVDKWAVGFAPRALLTGDLRAISPKIPVILHVNFGALIDSTAGLVTSKSLTASEEFALNVNRYHRFTFGAGLEVPIPIATLFVEYTLGIPLGVPNWQLTGPNLATVSVLQAMPQVLSAGFKLTPIRDVTLLFGVDFGLSRSVGLGVPATAPFNFMFGLSYAIDPFQRGQTKLVETIRERRIEPVAVAKAPVTGKVTGTVTDAKTKRPIAGAVLTLVGTGLPPVASEVDSGRFASYELPPGALKLKVSRDGYAAVEAEARIEAGKTTSLDLFLESQEQLASLDVTVTGLKKPIDALVALRGPTEFSVNASGGQGSADVKAGVYTVSVTADGYLSQTREAQFSGTGKVKLSFDLTPAPKKSLVVVKNDKIEILQQVHFATGKATILQDSFSLLQQVVDAVVRNGVRRLRVEGHTDNKGAKPANLKLSQERAQAVADFLIQKGLDKSRVEAAGYGDARPVAPNLTARGRELNRRVDFVILEK